jgi:hypothetical protein
LATRSTAPSRIGEFRFLTTGYTSAGRLVILAHADRVTVFGSSPRGPQSRMNEDHMSQQTSESEEDDIPEMELSGGVRGKYYEAYQTGTNVVLLEPDVATVFRDSAAVNQALRQYLSEHGAPPVLPKHAD